MKVFEDKSLPLSEQVIQACENYLYFGRRYTKDWNENIAIMVIRIVSWVAFAIPTLLVHGVCNLLQQLNSRTSEWEKILLQKELYSANSEKAISKLSFNSDIGKILIHYASGPSEGFLFNSVDGSLGHEFDKMMIQCQDGKGYTMKDGKKAVVIVFCNDSDSYKRYSKLYEKHIKFMEDPNVESHLIRQERVQGFLQGGNMIHPISWAERYFWIEFLGVLPPSLRRSLIVGNTISN